MTPAARRLTTSTLVAALLGTLLTLAAQSTAQAATHADAEQRMVEHINRDRAGNALPALALDLQLTRVARDWSAQMAAAGEMSHRPDLGDAVQGDWTRLGENVGYTVRGGATEVEMVQALHTAFMGSAGHRANVLGDYSEVGVGIQVAPAGTMWVTVNFSLGPPAPAQPQVTEAVRVSRQVFADDAADAVVLARAEVFADALGGAALAGRDAPVLFTPGPMPVDPDPALHPAARAEIDRVLPPGGTVYLLGGASAVSGRAEHELRSDGYAVRRLAGASRVETAVAVAREVVARHGNADEVLLARADDWADAVTGGAYAARAGSAVLLTGSEELHPAAAAFLAEHQPTRRWALGGPAALAEPVVAAAGAQRVAGPDRAATAVAVAEQLWGRTVAASGQRFVVTPGYQADGWSHALAYAPWSAVFDAPQLLVGDTLPPSVAAYLDRLGYGGAITGEITTGPLVPGPVLEQALALVR